MKVKANATMKSTLYLIDVEDQLTSMKLQDNDDPKTHEIFFGTAKGIIG